MRFALLTFIVAIVIAMVAGWFSIVGLMAIFAASAIPVAIMAGSLEVGKLVAASWVYRNWKRAPFLLKTYLVMATIVLMFITSMGIFGFLSKAHLEQSAQAEQVAAQVIRIERNIERLEIDANRLLGDIADLESETSTDVGNIQAQIDAEQTRMDNAYLRIQPAIDEQNAIISQEESSVEREINIYLTQVEEINTSLSLIQEYISAGNIESLQALVGTRVDGNYGSDTAERVETYREELILRREVASAEISQLRTTIDTATITDARSEIQRLREIAEGEVASSQATILRLRQELDESAEIDNTDEVIGLRTVYNSAIEEIDASLDEQFALETEVRLLEAEIGPIKYIAELVYGNDDRDTIDEAVRWLIIIFIFVFDPLAVLLLIAANYSFFHRNDHSDKQEEIFDTIFKKRDTNNSVVSPQSAVETEEQIYTETEKSLDKNTEIDDNSINVSDELPAPNISENIDDLDMETIQRMIDEDDPNLVGLERELERRINTNRILINGGWLDDISKK
jgi:hypothetical protein